ncbi:MAG: hypothetical protein LAQ69_01900 [Acidobacteriia bacterium]|nr:hypothetical protein [Terriglobia bacterium]
MRTWVTVVLGLALAPWAAANVDLGGSFMPSGPAHLRIAVRLVNSNVVPIKSLAQAEKIAGAILGQAGVEVNWLECAAVEPLPGIADPCLQDRRPTDLCLQMLMHKPPVFHGDVTGFAVLTPLWKEGESYAGVAYPMVEDTAKSLDGDVRYVLGATLAHEIGHLLLGAKAHFPSGVMRPRLEREQLRMAARGELLFTPQQASQIRAEVARRMAK